jgi:hypothetical protein
MFFTQQIIFHKNTKMSPFRDHFICRLHYIFYTSHIGKEAWVLMEKSKVGTPMHGFTDNYIRVEMDHDDQLDNQLIRVRMGGFNEEGTALKGVLV